MIRLRIDARGKNIEVTTALQNYVEKKLGRIGRYFDDEQAITALLSVQKGNHVVELTLPLGSLILRAEEATDDMYASIDSAADKIERQIRKYKTRINRKARRAAGEKPLIRLLENDEPEQQDEPRIVRVKRFALKPMDAEEAVLQMDLLGHDFFVFRDAASEEVHVVYRRRDGNYGLIEPRA